jgi:hypothetical protein
MAGEIIIRSANPNDISLEEAEEIASAVRSLNLNFDTQVVGQEREGYGVTLFEVLRISLVGGAVAGMGKALIEEVAKKLVDIVVEWTRKRFRGRKRTSKRPVYVAIYGPDGVVKSVVIRNATDEPEDRTEQDQQVVRDAKELRNKQ